MFMYKVQKNPASYRKMNLKVYNLKCLLTILAIALTRATPSTLTSRTTSLKSGGRGRSYTSTSPSAAASPAVKPVKSSLDLFLQTIKDSRKHLAAAAVARCASISIMFPMDTIKTRLQMSQANPFAVTGLYKGVGSSLIGQVPYGVLTFGSYEIYKKAFLEKFPNIKPAFIYALAAVCGDITGSGWLCPSEVVKQQSQAGMYASTGEAIRGIFKKKGIKGFYQGYLGGLARDVPFRVAQLTSYEVAKSTYLRFKKSKNIAGKENDVSLNPVESAIVGAVAGSFSAAITTPLDRIKTLLMTDSQAYGSSVTSCISKIIEDEGIKGLTKGLVPRVVYIAPSVAIFFIAYEQVQQRLSQWDQ